MASAGFEPADLSTKGQHATPRPLKPLYWGRGLNFSECFMKNMLFENKGQSYEINSILFKTGQQLCSMS